MKVKKVLELYERTKLELLNCYEEQVKEKIDTLEDLFIASEKRDTLLDLLSQKIMLEYLMEERL